MSVKVEDTSLSVGVTALNGSADSGAVSNAPFSSGRGTDLKSEIKIERVDADSVFLPPTTDVPLITDVSSLAEFMFSGTSSSTAAEANVIFKKEEDLDADENVFEAVIESRCGILTDNQEDFKCGGQLFDTTITCNEGDETPASEFGLPICSSSSNANVQFANIGLKSEKYLYNRSPSFNNRVRDVRVMLVDLFSNNSWESSSNLSINHIDSKSCECVVCVGKFRLPENFEGVSSAEKSSNSRKLNHKAEIGYKKSRNEKWYLCGACPARFIFAHNLQRHSSIHHLVHLCLACRMKFKCDADLRAHLKMHPRNNRHLCVFCDFMSKTEAELDVHLKDHRGEKCFSCAKCKTKFVEGYHLLTHLSECTKKSQFVHAIRFKMKCQRQEDSAINPNEKLLRCTYCPAKFKFGSRLRYHLMAHTNEGPHSCPHCSANFVTRRFLNVHIVKHSSATPFACTVCPLKFKRPERLRAHLLTHKDEKPYSCTYCDSKFRSKGPLNRHMKIHTEEKLYTCPYCDKTFRTPQYLEYHCMLHLNEKPHVCNQCPARFRGGGDLQKHLRKHTNNVKLFSCAHCSVMFANKCRLRIHLLTHSEERPYKCEHCSSAFKTKYGLQMHIEIHSEERPYKCNQCAAAFKSVRVLKQHLVSHSDLRPFKCNLCPAGFKKKCSLKHHRETHTREAVFKCEHCGLKFHMKQKLMSHMHIHFPNPHTCHHCPATFQYKSRLKSHLMGKHSAKKLISCPNFHGKFETKYKLKIHIC